LGSKTTALEIIRLLTFFLTLAFGHMGISDRICASVKVSAGRFTTVVGSLKFVQRGYDLTSTLALLPIVCIVSASLLTIMLIYVRKSQPCSVKQKLKPAAGISYVQVAPSSNVLPSLSHWPLRQQPSPLLSRQ